MVVPLENTVIESIFGSITSQGMYYWKTLKGLQFQPDKSNK
jgi:hypothetical protein